MELCTGGSLFNILDDPENTYGLEEGEFMLVLSHLSSGMKHLRDNNLVHRDLKPGNIMKFIKDDGTTVYKLTDFGAARELQEGQQFVSLYGTEEYLHPDMFERAVLRKPVGKTFGATVDLWSIGVTLYHVATGNLPFRPFGGRRNKETMYQITTKKPSGSISGVQLKDNGAIEYSRDLPQDCRISYGLKKIVTPLLAGLLEADPKRIWTFERFFREVTSILSCKVVHFFHVNRVRNLRVYIQPDDTYEQLRNYFKEQTEIRTDSQIILYKDQPFIQIVGETSRAQGYPDTSDNEPLLLFSKEDNNISIVKDNDLPNFPTFPNTTSVDSDSTQAKLSCSIGHSCKRRIEKSSLCCELIEKSVKYFSEYLIRELISLECKCRHLEDMLAAKRETMQVLETSFLHGSGQQSLNKLSLCNYTQDLADMVSLFKKETSPKVYQLHQRNVKETILNREWSSLCRSVTTPLQVGAPARAKTLVDRQRDSWQHLYRDRATRSLSYNDEQFHVLEKIKISETSRQLRSLLDQECIPAYVQRAEMLGDWYKIAQTTFLQTMILKKDVSVYDNKLEVFSNNLALILAQYNEEIKTQIESVKNDTKSFREQRMPKKENVSLKKSLYEVSKLTQEIMELTKENGDLTEEFKSLALIKLNKLKILDS